MKKKHKFYRASMSVEAVFVVPLILFILFFLLSFSFFTHQKVWFTEAAYEAVLSPEYEEEKAYLLLDHSPLAIGVPDVDIQRYNHHIKVTYRGNIITLGNIKLSYQSSAETQTTEPAAIIRKIRSTKQLTEIN